MLKTKFIEGKVVAFTFLLPRAPLLQPLKRVKKHEKMKMFKNEQIKDKSQPKS